MHGNVCICWCERKLEHLGIGGPLALHAWLGLATKLETKVARKSLYYPGIIAISANTKSILHVGIALERCTQFLHHCYHTNQSINQLGTRPLECELSSKSMPHTLNGGITHTFNSGISLSKLVIKMAYSFSICNKENI